MRFGTSRDVRLTGALAVAAHPDLQARATAKFLIGRRGRQVQSACGYPLRLPAAQAEGGGPPRGDILIVAEVNL